MKLKSLTTHLSIVALASLFVNYAAAVDQPLDDQEILNVENLYSTPPAEPAPAPTSSTVTNTDLTAEPTQNEKPQVKKQDQEIKNITELNQLSPFSEVSVIQKKYLPKTERFQLFGGVSMVTNSPWFLNIGGKLSLSYNFTEAFGLELGGMFLSNSEREVAKEIHDNNGLEPDLFVNTKAYYGIDVVWSPVYGKISLLNERIIPFDMYFSGGFGMSDTNSQEGTVPTFHLGTGQIFALSKAWAFRWDFSWTFFSATAISKGNATPPAKNSYNDLTLSAGLSFFFPEAKYR